MNDIYKQEKQYVVVHHSFDGMLKYKQFSSFEYAQSYMNTEYVFAVNELDADEFSKIMCVGEKEEGMPNIYIKVRKYDTIIYESWHIIEILVDVPLSDCE